MRQRVIYGALFALLALVSIVLCAETRIIFLIACCLIACREMRGALKCCGYNSIIWMPVALCVSSSLLLYFNQSGYVFPVFMILMILLFCQMILTGRPSVRDLFATLGVCAYPLSPIMLMVYVSIKPSLWAPVFLGSILPVIVSDTFALFGGKRFGKRKLSPHISPNKTVEGLYSGLIAGTLSGAIVHLLLVLFGREIIPLWGSLIVAFAAAAAGAFGDLAASAVKREAGLKDYSNLIPGHGGMLDRVDSSLFAIPAAYFLYALILAILS